MTPDIADVDAFLRTDSYLWSAVHRRGRDRQLEKELYDEINDLLDMRLELMKENGLY